MSKYFTLSFDDGIEQDKQLIQVLKQFDMPCTFNLNAGFLGARGYVAHIGEIGFMDLVEENKIRRKLFHNVSHNRIPADEVAQVYEGYEIASHGYKHEPVKGKQSDQITQSLVPDREELSRIFGQKITGYAYPGGFSSTLAAKYLKENGYTFGRTAFSSNSFGWPENPFLLKPTCSHKDKKIFDLLDAFIAADPGESDLLFMVWGHSYEFDFGTKNTSLEDHFKHVLEKAASAPDVICCTNSAAIQAHKAGTSQEG